MRRVQRNRLQLASNKASPVRLALLGSQHAQCAGTFDAISAALDWRFAPKWDLYFGAMFTQVNGGLAFGFLQRNTVDSTVGLRFRF